MAHFAKLSGQLTPAGGRPHLRQVLEVVEVDDDVAVSEPAGIAFLASWGGLWKQCGAGIRKQMPGIGGFYDEDADVYITQQPYPSWTVDSSDNWQPPTPMPQDGPKYWWSETAQNWMKP